MCMRFLQHFGDFCSIFKINGYITIYFKYRAKIKGSMLTSSSKCLSSNAYIFVLSHSLQLKLSSVDSSVSLLSFNMRFCMDSFNLQRVIHFYIQN